MDNRYRGTTALISMALLVVAACGPTEDAGEPAEGSEVDEPAPEATASFAQPAVDVDQPPAPQLRGDGEEPARSFDNETLENRGWAVAPWTRVADDGVAEAAEVGPGRITVSLDAVDETPDLEPLDVWVSAVDEQPWLRRVEAVDRTGDELVVETSPAHLEEAILEGSIRSDRTTEAVGVEGPQPAGDDVETVQQPLDDDPDYTELGSFDAQGLGLGTGTGLLGPFGIYDGVGASFDVDISGQPTASVSAEYWFSVDIDFAAGDKEPEVVYFFSTRECSEDTDCFDGGLAGGEECTYYSSAFFPDVDPAISNRLTDGQSYCTYNPGPEGSEVPVREEDGEVSYHEEYRTCEYLLEVLEWVKEDGDGAECGSDWEQWYDSEGQYGPRNPESCHGWFWDAFAPYPAQLEWAKMACSGTVDHLEFDVQSELDAGIEDFEMTGTASGFKAWSPIDVDSTTLASPTFWIGWVPVMLTVQFDFSAPFVLSASGSVELNAGDPSFVGVENASLGGGGIHMYGSYQAFDEGYFGPDTLPNGYLGQLHANEVDDDPADVQTPTVGGDLQGGVSMSLNPEVDVLLYDAVGPYLRPISPYVTAYATPGDDECNVGLDAGASGEVGVKAQLPFGVGEATDAWSPDGDRGEVYDLLGLNPKMSWQLYDTCGDLPEFVDDAFGGDEPEDVEASVVCRDETNPLCYSQCLVGDCEPEDDDDGDGSDDDGDGSDDDGDGSDDDGDGSDDDGDDGDDGSDDDGGDDGNGDDGDDQGDDGSDDTDDGSEADEDTTEVEEVESGGCSTTSGAPGLVWVIAVLATVLAVRRFSVSPASTGIPHPDNL